MKPKTIDEILIEFWNDFGFTDSKKDENVVKGKAKQQLLELFISCVPDEKSNGSNHIVKLAMGGWNGCRDQMIKNLEKLK